MLNRVIPIRPAVPALAIAPGEPSLSGRPEKLGRVLAGLEQLVQAEFGAGLPRAAWLRELHLDDGEAVLSLAPQLRRPGGVFAQAAFELLKNELHDTDIYVRAAAH